MQSSIWWRKLPAIAAVGGKRDWVSALVAARSLWGGVMLGAAAWGCLLQLPYCLSVVLAAGSVLPSEGLSRCLPFTPVWAALLWRCRFSDGLTKPGLGTGQGSGLCSRLCRRLAGWPRAGHFTMVWSMSCEWQLFEVLLCVCRVLSAEGPWTVHSFHVPL